MQLNQVFNTSQPPPEIPLTQTKLPLTRAVPVDDPASVLDRLIYNCVFIPRMCANCSLDQNGSSLAAQCCRIFMGVVESILHTIYSGCRSVKGNENKL